MAHDAPEEKTVAELLAESRKLRQRSLELEARAIELNRKMAEREAQRNPPKKSRGRFTRKYRKRFR